MCGIFGYFSETGTLSEQTLKRIENSLHHRGPNGQFIWTRKQKNVAMVSTRLSLNDLRDIQYPLSSQDGRIKMIFNGEFYDFKTIRNNLIKSGHQFTTETDSEIALHLYQEKGIHFLSQLRGEFAFIIWDENIQTLFAVRDRFGIKPLHYALEGQAIYLASEIPTLFAAGIQARWDKSSFYEYLHTNLHPEKTLFANIAQVPAGHYLSFNQYGVKCYKYWDLDYPKSGQSTSLSFADCVDQVRETLLDSVQLRLQADEPVAYYLSGGLDSAALLGMGAHLSAKEQHAFTLCFEQPQFNELDAARASAQHTGAHFHPVHISTRDLAEHFDTAAARAMVPMGNAAGIARFLLSKQVNQSGFKAVLSGEGADEVFFGYNFLRLEALEDPEYRQSVGNVDDFIEKMNRQFPVDRSKLKSMPAGFELIKQSIGYIPRWLQTQTYLYTSQRSLLSADMLQQFEQYHPYASYLNVLDVERQITDREPILQSLYVWIKAFFPNNLLSWVGDRMEMAHSVEGRQPFLDHHLFALARQIPTAYKISGTVEKHILREAVRPFVLPEIANKEKYMFQAPPLQINPANPLYQHCQDLIYTHLADTPFFDQNKTEAWLDGLVNIDSSDRIKQADASSTLMSVASIAALQKTYSVS